MIPLLLALAIQAPDTLRPLPADAYPDASTRAFVARLRAARDRNERMVTSYSATVKQRIGLGLRALARDRMLYRQELVARIDWRRDAPSSIELIGAREGIPVAVRGDRVPENLYDDARALIYNPAQDFLRLFEADDDGFVYPLRQGSEADYRFAAGDTTTITLPDGRQVRIVGLVVTPRRADWNLVSGTFWYDGDSHGLVQAIFRPARPYEFRLDADPGDTDGVPGWINPKAELKLVKIEYGLYELRWWLPRYLAMEATGTVGSWLNAPLLIERTYDDYEVTGGTPPPEGSTFRPAGTVSREPERPTADSAAERIREDSLWRAWGACVDSVTAAYRERGARGRVDYRARSICRRHPEDSNLVVNIPEDTLGLLASPELGPPILAMGDLISEDEVKGMADAFGQLPGRPWRTRLELPRGLSALLQHARYNRVEALSLGLSGRLELGPVGIRGIARLGLADLEPNGELSVSRSTPRNTRLALIGYRRLEAANPEVRPFGPINTFTALFAQRDDGEYYRTLGVELTAGNVNSRWWNGRMYLHRETAADVETDASLPHLFDGDRRFRPNIRADRADQAGASLTLRGTRALSRSLALGGDLTLDGATGDYDLGRGAATVRLFLTPSGPLAAALQLSAGTSVGTVPVQSRFYLGGAATLRGYAGGVLAGDAYWSGRVEVANSVPGVRLAVFSDVGWAGDRADFWQGRPLIGVGVGASFLDGLLRLDLARGLRAPTGWRVEVYVDGVL